MITEFISPANYRTYETVSDTQVREALKELRSLNEKFYVKEHKNVKKGFFKTTDLPNTYTLFRKLGVLTSQARVCEIPTVIVSKENILAFINGYITARIDAAISQAATECLREAKPCEKCNENNTAPEVTIAESVNHLCKSFLEDEGFKQAWIANIAMSYYDAVYQWRKTYDKSYLNSSNVRDVANIAATAFIDSLCKKDTE